MFDEIKKNIIDYWTHRAESYSALNRDELTWDREKMTELGYAAVDICEDIWKDVWTAEEKTNYASTPMFRITAVKESV